MSNTTVDNLQHITVTGVFHITFGTNVRLLWRLRGFKVMGVVLMLAFVFAPGYLFAQGCVQPPPGLVGWWPLDETSGTTVLDRSGLGNNGTATGPIGPGSNPKSVAGFVGNGLNFFSGSGMHVPPSPSLNFGPPAVPQNMSFTIDAWIKVHGGPILGNLSLRNQLGYAVAFADNGMLRLEMGTGSSTNTKTWFGPAITPNTWTFIAVVVDRSTQKVTLYTAPVGGPLAATSPPPLIPNSANAYSGSALLIGGCSGDTNGCDTVLDEVEVFNRALTQVEVQSILTAGSAGKCIPAQKKGMTWIHTASNAVAGTITVGCSGCDPYLGDTVCTQQLPLLCIYKPTPPPTSPFQVVPPGVNNSNQYNLWSGGVVATTPPHVGTFAHSTDATAYCQAQFGPSWRVAEFHEGWAWNFQAYGGTVSAPAVPSTRFWVHINDQPAANCWQTP
ncbi:MAG TPA: LamG domain-containing protein [Thermoanaerobaculia bacterium]|nr:LamG domain-containing protein [Thermoanaerobaculia bacterium]